MNIQNLEIANYKQLKLKICIICWENSTNYIWNYLIYR